MKQPATLHRRHQGRALPRDAAGDGVPAADTAVRRREQPQGLQRRRRAAADHDDAWRKLTRQQIQDELDKLEATLSGGGGTGVAVFSLRARGPTCRRCWNCCGRCCATVVAESGWRSCGAKGWRGWSSSAPSRTPWRAGAVAQLFPYPKDDVRLLTDDGRVHRADAVRDARAGEDAVQPVRRLARRRIGSR